MSQERTRKVGICMDSPTKLTHFTPLSSEVRQPMGSFSFAKFFRRNKEPPDTDLKLPAITTTPVVDSKVIQTEAEPLNQMSNSFAGDYWINSSTNNVKKKSDNVPISNQSSVNRDHERDIVYTRSLTNVLRRISSIRDKRSTAPQSYKDSDFKQYWMPDSNCKECYECGDKFTTFRRRHHCRVCGQIFCRRCCNQAIPGKLMGYSGDLRVCTHCCRIVLSYIQSSELGADLKTLQEELHNKLIMLNPFTDSSTYDFGSRTSLRRKNSVGFREEEFARMRYSSSSDISFSSSSNFMSVDQMSTERKILAQDSIQLRELWAEMQDPVNGVEFQNHRHRLRTFPNCVIGKELVDWLISMDKASTREQATAIGQALVDAKLLDCVTNQDELFLDEYALYKPAQHISIESPIMSQDQCENSSIEESQDPSWVKEICPDEEELIENDLDIVKNDEWSIIEKDNSIKENSHEEAHIISSTSLFTLQLDFEENRAILTKPKSSECSVLANVNVEHRREFLSSLDLGVQQVHQNISSANIADEFLRGALPVNKIYQYNEEMPSPLGWYNPDHLQVENGEKLAYERLIGAYAHHEHILLRQLLSVEGLSLSWNDIILPIVHKISDMVRPDVKNENDEMDIRQYVQFKKIPGGLKSDCSIISGAVCSKNVAHKKMRSKIQNPSILILSSPIIYQRQENKLLSLDPLVMQEYSYLKNVVLKIASFKPDIVLVEKTVSRLAQDFLLEQGITLVLNVKPSVTERVARCTQAYIISSIDAQITRPQLGMCPNFYVLEHSLPNGKTKTLMYFDGCATHLGCTVTLRGATNAELRKVKKIMQFMVYVAYNCRLERSFLMDEFGMPPVPLDEIPLIIGEEDEFDSCDEDLHLKDDDDSSVFIERSIGSKDTSDAETDGKNKLDEDGNGNDEYFDVRYNSLAGEMKESTEIIQAINQPNAVNKISLDTANDVIVDSDNKTFKMESHQIDDFSDPLHTLLHSDDENCYRRGSSQLHVAPLPFINTFRKTLDDIILSCSPYMKFSVPYLESDHGRNCELRQYFLDEIYWSIHLHKGKITNKKKTFSDTNEEQLATYETLENGYLTDDVTVVPWHPFITERLIKPFDEDNCLRGLLSDFRARGGRIYRLCPHQQKEKQKDQKITENQDLANKYNLSNAGLMWERQVDSLDPFHHQRLVVLFCSYSHVSNNTPNFCVNPRIVDMDFYGCNDITLGGFLERYCFRQAYSCPSQTCDTPMTDHVRKFAHENGCVHILLRQMEDPSPICQNTIAMWSWCRHCSQGTPFIPMSLDSWSFSFAKYLELRFHGKSYTRRGAIDTCCHSLHHDHYQYFGYKERVVAFKYIPIVLKEFAFPPLKIMKSETPIPHSQIIDEIKNLAVIGNDVYSTIFQWLIAMKNFYMHSKHEAYFSELIIQQEKEHSVFREKIEEIQLKLTSPTLESNQIIVDPSFSPKIQKDEHSDACQLMWKIHDCVVIVKRLIAEAASSWNTRKQEFIQQRKKEERPARLASGVARLISTSGSTSGADTVSPKSLEDGSNLLSVPGTNLDTSADAPSEDQVLSYALPVPSSVASCCESSSDVGSMHSEEGDVFRSLDSNNPKYTDEKFINVYESSEKLASISNAFCRETEISGSADCLSHSGSDPLLVRSSTPPLELADPLHSSPKAEVSLENRKTESRGHERSRSEGDGRLLSDIRLKIPFAKTDEDVSDNPRAEKKLDNVKTRFTQMISNAPSENIPIPFPPTEHHLLPNCDKIPIVVYENEIGSIIAYALSSYDYERGLQELRAALSSSQRDSLTNSPVIKKKNPKSSEKEISNVHGSLSVAAPENSGNLWKTGMLAFFRGGERSNIRLFQSTQCGSGFESVLYSATDNDLDLLDWEEVDDKESQYGSTDPDKVLRANSSKVLPEYHITVEFADPTSNFYCKVYFADQFRKLRKKIFPYGEESYIRSLSRCIDWQAKGGKSGLTFCKTQDDRFILKQMSRLEFRSFMDFAPHYFQHIMRAIELKKPTVLAKIVGVYRISYRNNQTNATSRLDLLVIENLFYSRNIVQKFDLKGSVRNRLVNTNGKHEGELVLLDENLLKMTCDNPLYIRPHSKTVLSLAINNDTQFLSRQHIMDYSLLVGTDEEKNELVIGIIDYVRTFTFDKKIEMVVKSSGFLGGQGKMPTVVSPELYRKRFCEAMDRYFLHVPDRWSRLGRGVDC